MQTERLHEKIATLKEEMQRLEVLEARMLATPDQQISLTDPDARSMATSGRGSGMVAHRHLPRRFASRNTERYAKQRGALLWTTGTTRNTAHKITSSGLVWLRPLVWFCSAVDTEQVCRGLSPP